MSKLTKSCFILVLIIFLSNSLQSTGLPVFDVAAWIQRSVIGDMEDRAWSEYLKVFDEFYHRFMRMKSQFGIYWGGFEMGEIDTLRINLDFLARILDSPFYRDIGKLDPWRDFFSELRNIVSEFPYLNRPVDLFPQSQLSQKPKYYRDLVEKWKKNQREYIKRQEAKLKHLKIVSDTERDVLKKLKEFDTQIAYHSLGLKAKQPDAKTNPGQQGKLKYFLVQAKLYQLKLLCHWLSLERMAEEDITYEEMQLIDYRNNFEQVEKWIEKDKSQNKKR